MELALPLTKNRRFLGYFGRKGIIFPYFDGKACFQADFMQSFVFPN